MSPILTRPVREQLEHDRIIRLLQGRYKRKFEVAINPGTEQQTSVNVGEMALYPDLVLFSQEKGHKLLGTVEVETGESVNTLEALAQWAPFSRLKAPFHLYVPPNAVDTARRLCAEHNVAVAEIWTYHTALDQVRFTLVHRAPEPPAKPPRTAREKTADKESSSPRSAKTDKPAKAASSRAVAKRAPARSAKSQKAAPRRAQPPARAVRSAKASSRKTAAVGKRR